ncbi:coiled-coil domain-containing protein 96 [Nycticebus coucang]|uniref:coiled-coil domain-containing protein 96 n=1 Tax=Nycticebus coucang TaxID=9470 RepID=UPI00234C5F48|nr:coiled-coil domain-containing protein 96 [Nycticebus coucang]
MDSQSEHSGDLIEDDGDVESLFSETKSRHSLLAEPAESEPELQPEPEPEEEAEVEAVGGGAAADEQAETSTGPAAAEAAGEEGPGEPGWPSEPEYEPEEPVEARAEDPATPVSEAGPEEPEEAVELEEEAAEGKKEPRARFATPLTTTGEEEAVPALKGDEEGRLEREEEQEPRVSEENEMKGRAGRGAKEEGKYLDVEDEDLEWSEEVQKQQEQQLRSELLEQYRSLLVDRNRYQRYNVHLQHRICEALRKKKGLEATDLPDKGVETEAPEKEQSYLRYLAVLEELKKQQADDLQWYHQELAQMKQQCQEKVTRVEKEWRSFQALKKQVVMQAMGSCRMRGGRQAALREVEQIQALEDKKEKEMSSVRLENVQLKQSVAHFETRMRAQEDLSEGLLLIDFEQLKIENQTFNEKVEERNEELLKLRNKVTNNVQIITHVKEKLHFMDMENACKKTQLLEIEAQVALGRDILTKTKQARDSLRVDNIKLNQKCGLLGKDSLLQDLEEKVEKTELLSQRLESLKRHHAGLTLSCRGVRQKIREAKAFLPS